VQVIGGTLGGKGTIAGPVTIGTGSSSQAILLPVSNASTPSNLKITSMLTFNPLSNYECLLERSTGKISRVTALGVTINDNVVFQFSDPDMGTLANGTVLTVINNTSSPAPLVTCLMAPPSPATARRSKPTTAAAPAMI
jgi:hypothetical protein